MRLMSAILFVVGRSLCAQALVQPEEPALRVIRHAPARHTQACGRPNEPESSLVRGNDPENADLRTV